MGKEIWAGIKGYPNHRVSNMGRVQTRQIRGSSRLGVWRDMRPGNCRGYMLVALRFQKIQKAWRLNRLVAVTFINNTENLPEVNHIDGDKLNNRASNLQWVTAKQNTMHAFKNGLVKRKGVSNSQAKLNDVKVREIRARIKSGETNTAIGLAYGVKQNTISQIKTGARWTHVV